MTITKQQNGTTLLLALEGRLDTMTAPELDEIVREVFDVTGFSDILTIE